MQTTRMKALCGAILFSTVASLAFAADMPLTRLTVEVKSATTGKLLDSASVIVRFREGTKKVNIKKMRTSWETKTNQQGVASLPEIPMGEIALQVIASGYQTFGQIYQLSQPEQSISVSLNPPQPQYSEDSKTR